MEQSFTRKGQRIYQHYIQSKCPLHFQSNPPFYPVLRWIQWTTFHLTSLRSILILSFYFRLDVTSDLHPARASHGELARISVLPIWIARSVRFILLVVITRTIFGGHSKSWSFPVCSFLQFSFCFLPLGPKHLPRHSISNLSLCSCPEMTYKFSHSM
jgi:hypothetical protein